MTYKNLHPNRTYVMKGTLMKIVTKQEYEDWTRKQGKNPVINDDEESRYAIPVIKSNGNKVTGKIEFKASKTGSGAVKITFGYDSSELQGKTLVVYERA